MWCLTFFVSSSLAESMSDPTHSCHIFHIAPGLASSGSYKCSEPFRQCEYAAKAHWLPLPSLSLPLSITVKLAINSLNFHFIQHWLSSGTVEFGVQWSTTLSSDPYPDTALFQHCTPYLAYTFLFKINLTDWSLLYRRRTTLYLLKKIWVLKSKREQITFTN